MRSALRLFKNFALVASLVFGLGACDAIDDTGSPFDSVDSRSTPTSGLESLAQGNELLSRSLSLLSVSYVEPVELPKLMAAGQRGAWLALAQSGLPPPNEVEYPPPQSGIFETPLQFQARYQRIAGRYSSKTEPLFLAREMVRQAA